MSGWIDAHNHLQDPRLGDHDAIIRSMREAGIEKCIVNATREDDWSKVESLAVAHPDFIIPAFGIHPWHAHTTCPGWQERLSALLIKYPQSSIGECGLDRWIDSPSIEIQTPIFIDQLRMGTPVRRIQTSSAAGKISPPFVQRIDRNRPPPNSVRRILFLLRLFPQTGKIPRDRCLSAIATRAHPTRN
jgi:hypothetical protein